MSRVAKLQVNYKVTGIFYHFGNEQVIYGNFCNLYINNFIYMFYICVHIIHEFQE